MNVGLNLFLMNRHSSPLRANLSGQDDKLSHKGARNKDLFQLHVSRNGIGVLVVINASVGEDIEVLDEDILN